MENQRHLLIIVLIAISAFLYTKWIEFSNPDNQQALTEPTLVEDTGVPTAAPAETSEQGVPSVPVSQGAATASIPSVETTVASDPSSLITVNTDLVVAVINTKGGVIERLELKKEPLAIDTPEQGFPLLKRTPEDIFVTEDGLINNKQSAPNHTTQYISANNSFDLGSNNTVAVPLTWVSDGGIEYTKTITFNRDSYIVNIDYSINNTSAVPWTGYQYAQFNRTQPEKSGGGFGQLPSFTGGAIYEQEDHYQKIKFKDMAKENLSLQTDNGWVAMIQHYFVGAWIPDPGNKEFFSSAGRQANPQYRIGYKTKEAVVVAPGATGTVSTKVYLGSKEQRRLKRIQKDLGVEGLAKTVDFTWLTPIADPLFTILDWIHSVVGNWGWSIILLTLLIKIVFYPLSAASYKSMAGMKKLQPRMKTLKERYKDDRQKFQMEMMALYKTEKINPAGGCLPILIQIPVFIALYWVLLESVELRQAPFALWWQDLSAPDPYYVLPVLMGLSMWVMQKLNPAAMDEIQRKVMMVMPIALTFLFLSFPQGLVLYWVVNNILSMAQQWYINRKYAV